MRNHARHPAVPRTAPHDSPAASVAVVHVRELDLQQGVSPLRWELHDAVAAGARSVVVDMHGVPRLSSTAVSSLLNVHRYCRARGGHVELVNCERSIVDLLRRTALHRVFVLTGDASRT